MIKEPDVGLRYIKSVSPFPSRKKKIVVNGINLIHLFLHVKIVFERTLDTF